MTSKINLKLLLNATAMLFAFFTSSLTFSQDEDPVPVEDDEKPCWCEKVKRLPSGTVAVFIIDSLIISKPNNYSDLIGCKDGDCEGTKCSWKYKAEFQRKIKKEGDCQSKNIEDRKATKVEPGVADVADVVESCDCIFKKKLASGIYVYRNITEKKEKFPTKYHMVNSCDENCEKRVCSWQKIDPITNAFGPIQNGFCSTNPIFKTKKDEDVVDPKSQIQDFNSDLELGNINTAEITLYPNPANGIITIKGGTNIITSIYSSSGELVLESTKLTIDISKLTPGAYIVNLISKDQIYQKKLIIE